MPCRDPDCGTIRREDRNTGNSRILAAIALSTTRYNVVLDEVAVGGASRHLNCLGKECFAKTCLHLALALPYPRDFPLKFHTKFPKPP